MVLFKNYSLSETDTDEAWWLDCPPIIGNRSSTSRILLRKRKQRQPHSWRTWDSQAGWVCFPSQCSCSGISPLSSLKEQALVNIGCSTLLFALKAAPFSVCAAGPGGSTVRRKCTDAERHQPGPVSPARSLAVGPGHMCVFPGSQVPQLRRGIIALLCRGAAG